VLQPYVEGGLPCQRIPRALGLFAAGRGYLVFRPEALPTSSPPRRRDRAGGEAKRPIRVSSSGAGTLHARARAPPEAYLKAFLA